MFSTIDLSNLSLYNHEGDVVASIENSLQTRQISRLKPSFITVNRPQTSKNRSITQYDKIIPELKVAVDTLRSRLKYKPDLKLIPRPSCRLNFTVTNEELFPGKYTQKSAQASSFEFTKTPRMQNSIDHKLTCLSKIQHFTKKSNNKIDFELKNMQTVAQISDYYTNVKTRTKKHNEKVSSQAQAARFKKTQERESKKSEYLYKTERFRWMQMHGPDIEIAKKKWTNVLICYTVACTMKISILRKKFLKKKVAKTLNFIKVISWVLGKILRLLKKKRKFLMYRNVRVYVTPVFNHIEIEKRNFCREISKFVWKVTNSHHCLRLFISWKRSFDLIKKALIRFIKVRQARIEALTIIFNRFSAQNSKKDRRVSLTSYPTIRQAQAPKKVVAEYLKFYIHRQMTFNTHFQLFSDKNIQIEFLSRLSHSPHKRIPTSFT